MSNGTPTTATRLALIEQTLGGIDKKLDAFIVSQVDTQVRLTKCEQTEAICGVERLPARLEVLETAMAEQRGAIRVIKWLSSLSGGAGIMGFLNSIFHVVK